MPEWPGHLAGQHVDLRLTAADGYQAQRSYSLAGPANGDRVELTVQRIPGGEVSPYLTEVFAIGDPVELRGPVGGWFVWQPTDPVPVLLIAGGSGVVPLMAMIRARRAAGNAARFRLVYSVRAPSDRYYSDELAGAAGHGLTVSFVYTRVTPTGWPTPARRLSATDLDRPGWAPDSRPLCFVCGPTGFVEAAADLLVALGHPPAQIKTERFGPSGGADDGSV